MIIYDLVRQLLIEFPELRDNDKRLIWAVWYRQGLVHDGKITRESFYGEAEYPESITRARRKVQELFPELEAKKAVKELRSEKEADKGNFVFKEQVKVEGPIEIPYEVRLKMIEKTHEDLIKKGILKK